MVKMMKRMYPTPRSGLNSLKNYGSPIGVLRNQLVCQLQYFVDFRWAEHSTNSLRVNDRKRRIDQIWNKFWSGGISNPLTAIEQITYLLFMKRLDELDQKKEADAKWTNESYASKFTGTWFPPEHRDKPEKAQKPFAVKR